MKFGAEPKKLAVLVVLCVVGVYVFYSNVIATPDGESRPSARPSAPLAAAPNAGTPSVLTGSRTRASAARRSMGAPRIQEFRPSLLPGKGEEPDLNTIDPTLRLDLLRRVQTVSFDGAGRNVFQFSAAPPPPTPPAPKIVPKTPQQVAQEQAQIAQSQPNPGDPARSAPLPINLKFYGYAKPSREGVVRAFLQDGDSIFVAEEGEVVSKRYRVVRIRTGSVDVEDTQSHNAQTLPLTPPPQPGVG